MRARNRRWDLIPGVIGLILLLVTLHQEGALAQCWGDYCTTPPPGECIGDWCERSYYYAYTAFVESCGWCERWVCEEIEICLFGGGCSCLCWYDSWWDECTGYPV